MLSSFYPVVSGRTSDALARYRSLYQVQVSRLGIQQLEDQLSTGKRISVPSQDPTAAIRIMGVQRNLEFRDQTLRNLDSSQSYLNVTESTLSNIQDIVTELRGLAVESAGNLAGDSERTGWITQINASIARITSAANSKYQDRYLFSGGAVSQETVSGTQDYIRFTGNDESLMTIADDGQYLAHNVTGQKALGLISDGVVSRVDLDPAALPSTRLADLNSGRGVTSGAIAFSDGIDRVVIDLAGSDTIEDVMARINSHVQLSGRDVQVGLNNGALTVSYADGNPGQIRILESGAGRAAADLGILTPDLGGTLPITGQNLDPVLRPTTLISQLNGNLGLDLTGNIRIEQKGNVYDISLASATTVEDITNAINGSGAAVRADIAPDGRTLRVRSTESGSDFSISESSGTLAERLGLRTFHAGVRLDQLNYGRGVSLANGPDLILTRNDGSEFSIDLDGAITIGDVVNRINNDPNNQDALTKITAGISSVGNGLTLSSEEYVAPPLAPPLTTTPGPIRIRNAGGSQAGWDLGFIDKNGSESVATTSGTTYSLTSTDTNPQEVKGVFNSLIRLRNAIESKDSAAVSRAVDLIDEDLSRLSLSRGSLGVEQQYIDNLRYTQEDNKVALKADESKDLEVDMASAITELTGRQAAYEASLKLLSTSSQMSLFNYL